MSRMTDVPFRTPEGGVLLWSLIGEYLRAFTGVKISLGRRLCKSLTESIPSASKSSRKSSF